MDNKTSEITKLTERISKDPKSKLFVPLAEEYKKAGDIEMSIHVLTEGLKNNPGYVTARSFLGRLLIDKGDLAGAQKEFEEVVKAIPDNLMAQRKLGDIYALQDRPADALSHYKTALSLNPKDQETALLVSEAEAGRDIKKYLPKPKPPVAAEEQKKPDSSPVSAPVSSPVQQAAASAAKQSPGPAQRAAAVVEEPEEVLIVEPLDAVASRDIHEDLAAKGLAFLAEPAHESSVQEGDEKGDALFSEPFGGQPAALKEPAQEIDDPFSTDVAGETEKQSDDFTTDTLAELYISQGFFEKAVDIYERMLVDKPNSQGLKNKLANVRAMASSGTAETKPAAQKGEAGPAELDAYVPPPVHEIPQPAPDDWEVPATTAISVDEKMAPQVRASKQTGHFDVGFEPREYVPPDAVPRQASQKQEEQPARPVEKTGKPAEHGKAAPVKSSSRKETVDRLESWLKNIIKET